MSIACSAILSDWIVEGLPVVGAGEGRVVGPVDGRVVGAVVGSGVSDLSHKNTRVHANPYSVGD